MINSDKIPQYDDHHYAVVDLGSNSFHLSISSLVNNKFKTIAKVKQKIRLAAGLNNKNELNEETIKRGLDCITLFSKHLASIPPKNIQLVATATLRIAVNRDKFLIVANNLLPKKIHLLSGEQEAFMIYSGMAHTSENENKKRLVLDIGGASTELIIGNGFNANKALSLNLGCVSFKEKYFTDGQLTNTNFNAAIQASNDIINPIKADFINIGWQSVVGSSGTMQALAEILISRQQKVVITAGFLQEIKQALINIKTIDALTDCNNKSNSESNDVFAGFFSGLRADRAPVLASGLSILIALFNCLKIKELKLSKGALREGLLFEMIPSQTAK